MFRHSVFSFTPIFCWALPVLRRLFPVARPGACLCPTCLLFINWSLTLGARTHVWLTTASPCPLCEIWLLVPVISCSISSSLKLCPLVPLFCVSTFRYYTSVYPYPTANACNLSTWHCLPTVLASEPHAVSPLQWLLGNPRVVSPCNHFPVPLGLTSCSWVLIRGGLCAFCIWNLELSLHYQETQTKWRSMSLRFPCLPTLCRRDWRRERKEFTRLKTGAAVS